MSVRNKNIKNLFAIIFCIMVIAGCKKNPFDYRSKFLGDYNFTVHFTSYGGGVNPIVSTDTVYNYIGKVEFGTKNNTVLISFSDGLSFEPTIYEDLTLDNYGGNPSFNGEFESKTKIKFDYHYWRLSGNDNYFVTGIKK